MDTKKVITKFYTSFAGGNVEGMIHCYDQDIIFKDPAFGQLEGEEVRNMWRMLIKRSGGNIKINFGDIEADETNGTANWTAEYVFTLTGRTVFNKISAKFDFKNGKIIHHTDHFDMWKWARQALGWKGYLFGWSTWMKNKIKGQANNSLKKYCQK